MGASGKWLRRVRSDHKTLEPSSSASSQSDQIGLEAWPTPRKRTDYQFRAGISNVIHSSQATPLKPAWLADGQTATYARPPSDATHTMPEDGGKPGRFVAPMLPALWDEHDFSCPMLAVFEHPMRNPGLGQTQHLADPRPKLLCRIIPQGGAGRLS